MRSRSSTSTGGNYLTQADKKLLFWMGAAVVVFAIGIARVVTGSWLGALGGIVYCLLCISPVFAGVGTNAETERDRLEETADKQAAEIARLRQELAEAKGAQA